jgi:hypothetical protein
LFIAIGTAFVATLPTRAHAQLAVIDVANLAQNYLNGAPSTVLLEVTANPRTYWTERLNAKKFQPEESPQQIISGGMSRFQHILNDVQNLSSSATTTASYSYATRYPNLRMSRRTTSTCSRCRRSGATNTGRTCCRRCSRAPAC